MAVKLHRCRNEWAKITAHPCWKIEKALQDMGIEYEVALGPVCRSKRDHMEKQRGSGSIRRSSSRTGRCIARSRRTWRSGSATGSFSPNSR